MASSHIPGVDNRRYSGVAIALHWTIALLILINIYFGLQFDDLKGMALYKLLQLHKSIGITVLLLALIRLLWRLVNRPPPYPAGMKTWEKGLAHATHWAFYGLIVGLPLTGWIVVSASLTNIPTLLYRTVHWPHLGFIHSLPLIQRKALADQVSDIHSLLAWTTIGLLVLHVAAALKHQFYDRDPVLWRMAPIPGLKPPNQPTREA